MAIAVFYISDLIIPYFGTIATRTFLLLLYQSSFFVIFVMVLVFGYVRGKTESKERRRVLVKIMRIVMLGFVILAYLTYILARLWDTYYSQPIQTVFFVFLSLIEVFILEIHNMAFSEYVSGTEG